MEKMVPMETLASIFDEPSSGSMQTRYLAFSDTLVVMGTISSFSSLAMAAVSAPKKKAKKKAVKKVVKQKVTKKASAQSGRKPMTAAQKKIVSAHMKAYWAKRKKAKG